MHSALMIALAEDPSFTFDSFSPRFKRTDTLAILVT